MDGHIAGVYVSTCVIYFDYWDDLCTINSLPA